MGTTIISDAKTSMPRFKCDCFSSSALAQIRDVFNGDEPTYRNRGGVGYDIRELSEFALSQISGAVGGRTFDIRRVWLYDVTAETVTEVESTTTQSGRTDFEVDLTEAENTKFYVYVCVDDEEPLDENGDMVNNIAVMFDVEVQSPRSSYAFLKNVGIYYMTSALIEDTFNTNFVTFDNTMTEKLLINIYTKNTQPKTDDSDNDNDNNDAPIDNDADNGNGGGGGSSDK